MNLLFGRWVAAAAFVMVVMVLVGACTDAGESTADASSSTADPEDPAEGGTTGAANPEPTQIQRVIDGDSLELFIDDQEVEARLLDVNAPELFDDAGQATCAGITAKEQLEAFVAAQPLLATGAEEDRFGRLLVSLSALPDSTDPSADAAVQLASLGWAVPTGPSDSAAYQAAVRASEQRLGMWGSDGCGAPAADSIAIVEVQADPPGRDDEALNNEYIVLANQGIDGVNLAGWTVRDNTTGHRYTFGQVILDPDATVTLRSGAGTDSATDLYWGETFPVWSNQDEVAILLDPSGIVAAWMWLP